MCLFNTIKTIIFLVFVYLFLINKNIYINTSSSYRNVIITETILGRFSALA